MTRSRALVALLSVLVLLGLAGCGSDVATSGDKASGLRRVAVGPGAAPNVYGADLWTYKIVQFDSTGTATHVYGNVHFDLSLTIPHVSRPAVALAEALELAPVSKLLYASDAARTPELYLLAAIWWRDALAAVLPEALPAAAAENAARMILRENAQALYRLSGQRPAEVLQNG